VKIRKLDISEVADLSITAAADWFGELDQHLTPKQREQSAQRILKEINERLGFLRNVGLEYLTLARASGTLSGGESQRIRLASQIGLRPHRGSSTCWTSRRSGYISATMSALLQTLKRFARSRHNTVIVVEHDEDAIRNADYLIDMGASGRGAWRPCGGRGLTRRRIGEPPTVSLRNTLTGRRRIEVPATRRRGQPRPEALRHRRPRANNLQNVTVDVPIGNLRLRQPASPGGGKSTLVIDTLYKALARRLMGAREHPRRP